jgi:hypothetical protein
MAVLLIFLLTSKSKDNPNIRKDQKKPASHLKSQYKNSLKKLALKILTWEIRFKMAQNKIIKRVSTT